MKYTFTIATHEDFGTLGLKPKWYPDGDPLGGMAAAHDILEHFHPDMGGAEGEFMALGASYRIRGETGYFQRNGNVNDATTHLASDFPMIFQAIEAKQGHTRIRPCAKVCRLEEKVKEAFQAILRKAVVNLQEEVDNNGSDFPAVGKQDHPNILAWMAYGYQKAGQRYSRYHQRGIGFYEIAYCLFAKIEEEAEKALKVAEEGMTLTVSVNFLQLQVETSLNYEDFYNY
jgi:hypothetical protein